MLRLRYGSCVQVVLVWYLSEARRFTHSFSGFIGMDGVQSKYHVTRSNDSQSRGVSYGSSITSVSKNAKDNMECFEKAVFTGENAPSISKMTRNAQNEPCFALRKQSGTCRFRQLPPCLCRSHAALRKIGLSPNVRRWRFHTLC